MKRFADLREQEVLALAISNEDEDNLIYRSFADGLRSSYPDTAGMFDKMAEEEIEHRGLLLDLYRKKFGGFLPLIRRQDMKGFVARRPIWLNRPLAIDATRKFADAQQAALAAAGAEKVFAERLAGRSPTGRPGFWSQVQQRYANRICTSLPSSLRIAWKGVLKPRHFLGVRLAVMTMS